MLLMSKARSKAEHFTILNRKKITRIWPVKGFKQIAPIT